MVEKAVGILGLGYLGMELCSLGKWPENFWVTGSADLACQKFNPQVQFFNFRWEDPATWQNLPDLSMTLIITIPPLLDLVEEEKQRLQVWCTWMKRKRKGIGKIVYVSTTGVYPNQPGIWQENSTVKPDSVKGELRLVTEQVLNDFFETKVIRSGAIYGKGRNVGERLIQHKPVPNGLQPIHRIHVHDLVRISRLAVDQQEFPGIVNAVDLKPATSRAVANWLLEQSFFSDRKITTVHSQKDFETRKFDLSEPNRKISNQLLINTCQFAFSFPTYQEGLAHAFDSSIDN